MRHQGLSRAACSLVFQLLIFLTQITPKHATHITCRFKVSSGFTASGFRRGVTYILSLLCSYEQQWYAASTCRQEPTLFKDIFTYGACIWADSSPCILPFAHISQVAERTRDVLPSPPVRRENLSMSSTKKIKSGI